MKRTDMGNQDSIRSIQNREEVYWRITNFLLVGISLLVMVQNIVWGLEAEGVPSNLLHQWRLSSIALPGIVSILTLYFSSRRKITRKQHFDSLALEERARHAEAHEREALRANRRKEEFIANLSHEIRTPIATMLGYAEILQMHELSTWDKKDALRILHQNGLHLSQLVEDLLEHANLTASAVNAQVEPVSISRTMAEASVLIEPLARTKGIALEIHVAKEVPDTIESDPLRLRQILLNLLGNAVKFTNKGEIRITARVVPDDSGDIEIRVQDTGIGIEQKHLDSLFEAFFQVDGSTTRQFGGTGLGLSISHRLAGVLQGSIRAESRYGEGSSFTLRIPREVSAGKFTTPSDTRPIPLGEEELFASTKSRSV